MFFLIFLDLVSSQCNVRALDRVHLAEQLTVALWSIAMVHNIGNLFFPSIVLLRSLAFTNLLELIHSGVSQLVR